MKRFPLVFLSLVILVTCTWLASSSPRVGKAATNRALPWWFGDEDYFYSEFECTDGMALWVTNSIGPKIDVVATLVQDGSVLVDETFTMAANHPDGVYKYFGEYILRWPYELPPGSKIFLELNAYKNNPDTSFYSDINLWIKDCKLPEDPQPSAISTIFGGSGPAPEVNNCETYEIDVSPYDEDYNDIDLIIGDLDVGLHIGSAPAAHVSATLESPNGTRVKLFDRNHKASFQMGTTCSDYDFPLPDFVFDDDSIYSLADANRPFNQTAFSPFPDALSAFIGEKANGTWKLEVCNYEAPESEQVFVGANGGFEEGNKRWTKSSTNGRNQIYSMADSLNVIPYQGQWLAWLGGADDELGQLSQVIRPRPSMTYFDPYLRFWYQIKSSDDCYNDFASIILNDVELRSFNLCANNATSSWVMEEIFMGYPYGYDDWVYYEESTFKIEVETDATSPSSFYIDNIGWIFKEPGSVVACSLLDFTVATPEPQYALDIIIDGQGNVQKSPSYTEYDSGQVVTLTADPYDGYAFSGWSGDASGTANPIQITMNGNKAVTATFTSVEPNTYTLETDSSVGGNVLRNPDMDAYPSGEVVTLTADPVDGYFFNGWSGDAGGTANPIQLTMNGNKSVTATFTPIEADTYTLQTTTTGSGTIQRDPDLEAYPSGQKVILTAVADDGYLFSGWSGDASGMETPIQITMNGNKSVTASFAPISPDTYTLQTPTSGGGIILRNPNQTVYQSGQVVTLTADPDYGYVFNGWSGDASGTTNPIQITMDGNKFVTTFFELVGPNTYTLNTPSSAGGSINRNPDKPVYQSGEVVTLTAVPANGYLFDAWNGDANGWGNPTQITMDSNKSVGATFTPIGNSDDFINFMPLVIR